MARLQFLARSLSLVTLAVILSSMMAACKPVKLDVVVDRSTLRDGMVNRQYQDVLIASVLPRGPATFEWLAIQRDPNTSALPEGLSLSPDGVISGVPRRAGNFTVGVMVKANLLRLGTTDTVATVEIRIHPELTVEPFEADPEEGQTRNFRALAITVRDPIDFRDVTSEVQWASSNPSVASIASNGAAAAHQASPDPVAITATLPLTPLHPEGPNSASERALLRVSTGGWQRHPHGLPAR